MTDLSVCPALSMESFLMWSRPRASFLLLYSRVSECIVRIYIYMCLRKGNGGKARKHLCILVLHCVCVVLPVCACVYACTHARTCLHLTPQSPHSARHSMYSSALLIAGCWSKIIVIFQPVGLKSYNIMKCIKKRGKWQTGGMLNQM